MPLAAGRCIWTPSCMSLRSTRWAAEWHFKTVQDLLISLCVSPSGGRRLPSRCIGLDVAWLQNVKHRSTCRNINVRHMLIGFYSVQFHQNTIRLCSFGGMIHLLMTTWTIHRIGLEILGEGSSFWAGYRSGAIDGGLCVRRRIGFGLAEAGGLQMAKFQKRNVDFWVKKERKRVDFSSQDWRGPSRGVKRYSRPRPMHCIYSQPCFDVWDRSYLFIRHLTLMLKLISKMFWKMFSKMFL